MATESFLVTALPHSADAARDVHLCLFVTHRLTPDGPAGVVGGLPHRQRVDVRDSPVPRSGCSVGPPAGGMVRIPVTAQLGRP